MYETRQLRQRARSVTHVTLKVTRPGSRKRKHAHRHDPCGMLCEWRRSRMGGAPHGVRGYEGWGCMGRGTATAKHEKGWRETGSALFSRERAVHCVQLYKRNTEFKSRVEFYGRCLARMKPGRRFVESRGPRRRDRPAAGGPLRSAGMNNVLPAHSAFGLVR